MKHLMTAAVVSVLICLAGCEADVNMVDFGEKGESAQLSYDGSWRGDDGRLSFQIVNGGLGPGQWLHPAGGDYWNWDGSGSQIQDGMLTVHFVSSSPADLPSAEDFSVLFTSETSGEAWLSSQHPTHVTIRKQ